MISAGMIVVPTQAQVNVTQEHNHLSRDGLYIDSAFTRTAAANLRRDLNFNGTILGSVYAQPLYIENGTSPEQTNSTLLLCRDPAMPLQLRLA